MNCWARLETLPRIEQAKGIIMAQSGCTDTMAFDVLPQASQRLSIPVRELTVQLVARVGQTAGGPGGRLTPSPGLSHRAGAIPSRHGHAVHRRSGGSFAGGCVAGEQAGQFFGAAERDEVPRGDLVGNDA
jgi:ANTAR domain